MGTGLSWLLNDVASALEWFKGNQADVLVWLTDR